MIESINELKDTLEESLLEPNPNGNIERSERILSIASGAFLFCKGVTNLFSHPTIAMGELLIGGTLLHRGVTGFCPVKGAVEAQDPISETIVVTELQDY
jgi:Flp pilus assembly protein TadB